jgi:hypothetical protein
VSQQQALCQRAAAPDTRPGPSLGQSRADGPRTARAQACRLQPLMRACAPRIIPACARASASTSASAARRRAAVLLFPVIEVAAKPRGGCCAGGLYPMCLINAKPLSRVNVRRGPCEAFAKETKIASDRHCEHRARHAQARRTVPEIFSGRGFGARWGAAVGWGDVSGVGRQGAAPPGPAASCAKVP